MTSSREPEGHGECSELLEWALPRMGYAWPGFRRVYRQVCKRIGRRLRELHLGNLDAYRRYLDANPDEWRVLDGFCRITISRFARDRPVFDRLGREVLPCLARAAVDRGAEELEAWSVGCARGEEPYTLSAVWRFMVAPDWPDLSLSILATDTDQGLLERARDGVFGASSLRELRSDWQDRMFNREDGAYSVRPELREAVSFRLHDVRDAPPRGGFDLILCRNLVLTYFDAEMQWRVLERLISSLRVGGAFVIGARETPPPELPGLVPWWPAERIYRRESA